MYAPYHAVDIYVRGDVAEFWAFAFIPLVFLGLWQIYKQAKWRYVALTSITLALVIISHNLTAMMISPFLVLFAGYLLFKAKNNKSVFISASISDWNCLSCFLLAAGGFGDVVCKC